jgi:hypothetical protein
MTTAISITASLIAIVIPAFLFQPIDPAVILGFAVVGTCLFFAGRDYLAPRRRGIRRHG